MLLVDSYLVNLETEKNNNTRLEDILVKVVHSYDSCLYVVVCYIHSVVTLGTRELDNSGMEEYRGQGPRARKAIESMTQI